MFECTSWNTKGLQQVKGEKVMSEEMNDQMLVRRQKLQNYMILVWTRLVLNLTVQVYLVI